MLRRNADLLVVTIGAFVAFAAATIGPGRLYTPLTLCLVLPLVVIYPGYAMTAALDRRHGDPLARWTAVLAMSIGLTILGSVLLHYTGAGLSAVSRGLLLLVITTAAAIVAGLRRERGRGVDAAASPGRPRWVPAGAAVSIRAVLPRFVLYAAAAAVTVGAVSLVRWAEDHVGRPSFTQLWLREEPDAASVHIGLRNLEGRAVVYDLEMSVAGQTLRTWSQVQVAADETWEDGVTLPPLAATRVDFTLFRRDRPGGPYRRVAVWTHPAPPSAERDRYPSVSTAASAR